MENQFDYERIKLSRKSGLVYEEDMIDSFFDY